MPINRKARTATVTIMEWGGDKKKLKSYKLLKLDKGNMEKPGKLKEAIAILTNLW